jgi:acyl-CoA synthetase (AMP-forming)/AMP-acid ligase II
MLLDWEQSLAGFLRGRIARYKLPRQWVHLDALPRTALGKVQKAQLARQVQALAAARSGPQLVNTVSTPV